ncbi:jg25686 [Pararge aegeria aegeria]|uniref:Jg25686 protein n=2 Tax=Pararge aegeria TaxID=116150 RepID=A0A8S4SC01_9NEOP|nr:jg25686 [Pararge aegeria aegeria]
MCLYHLPLFNLLANVDLFKQNIQLNSLLIDLYLSQKEYCNSFDNTAQVNKMPRNRKTMKLIAEALGQCHIAISETTTKAVLPTSVSEWPKLRQKVPDIFLHKPADFAQHVHKLLSMGIKFNQPYLGRYYTKITCPTFNDHKALVIYFEKKQLPFNTFGNPAKRKLKAVIRGLPKDTDLNLLKTELKSLSIPIVRVHNMQRFENVKNRTSLVLAVVPYNDDGKKLLQVKHIMGHDVTMEPPNPKPKQCYRCQMWGHTQRYCHGQVKCVKCAGEHISKKCERNPNTEQPKCANCGGEHTASYRKCPCCPDSLEHKQSQLMKHNRMQVLYRKPDLVTLENCDTLYKNILYKPDFDC